MRRFLAARVPLWTLLALALFSAIAVAAVAASKKTETTVVAAATTSTTSTTASTTTTTTGPTTTTVATTTTVPQPVTVLDISGSNKTSSDNFTALGTRTIHAEVNGGAGISVTIKTPSGQTVDYITFDQSGDSVQRKSGSFFLEVSPFGASYR